MLVVWNSAEATTAAPRYRPGFSPSRIARRSRHCGASTTQWMTQPNETLVDLKPGPDVLLDLWQLRETLTKALEGLSAEHRAVVELTYFHGLGYREIAQIVSCPVDTVKTRMFHARRRLQAMLAGEPEGLAMNSFASIPIPTMPCRGCCPGMRRSRSMPLMRRRSKAILRLVPSAVQNSSSSAGCRRPASAGGPGDVERGGPGCLS